MPKIKFKGKEIECNKGQDLRSALLALDLTPHNKRAKMLNCKGLGTCGTCAVLVEGEVSKMSYIEKRRLSFPPHNPDDGLRLACQCRVHGDIDVIKGDGFWGEKINPKRKTA